VQTIVDEKDRLADKRLLVLKEALQRLQALDPEKRVLRLGILAGNRNRSFLRPLSRESSFKARSSPGYGLRQISLASVLGRP